MVQAPGIVKAEEIPAWVGTVQIILETGWTEREVLDTSLWLRQKLIKYLNGRARGLEQKARRERGK